MEIRKAKRLEKNKEIERVRVESVTIYERGNNERPFQSVVGDKERNQGFVELYDLEVENHPSYFVEDVLVHNCHQLSKDAQNAFLKILEDTPTHVYFILCTTDPQKLIPTLKGRCSQYQVGPLSDSEIFKLLRSIVSSEEETLKKPVYEQIMTDSFGRPREAIQILEQVLSVDASQRLETAKKAAEQQNQSIELCRALVSQQGWKAVSNILKGLKDEDPEGVRRHVLAYLETVLLSGENDGAAAIMEEFLEPFYSSGFAGLVYACYSSVNG